MTNLMAGDYLEPALFNKENNALAAEVETLRQEKDSLIRSVNGDMQKAEELQKLIRFVSKGDIVKMLDTSRATVQRMTKTLVEQGKIERIGGKRYGYWVIHE